MTSTPFSRLPRPRLLAYIGVAALVLAMVGCSGSVTVGGGEGSVSKEEVEKKGQAQFDKLAQAKGQESFPPLECDGDLEAKVGTTERCVASFDDGKLGITVTVTSVKDGTAHMDFQADEKVTPLNSQ